LISESKTMNLTLTRLRACPNAQTLATELVGTCTRYGAIRYLKVLMATHRGQLQALCFWQMGDACAEQRVMDVLPVHRVADYLVLVIAIRRPQTTLTTEQPLWT
jgi:hypothetical protein